MQTHADSYEEIRPLAELCRSGRLYEVEDWIRQGKPIDPPVPPKGRQRTPLLIAIERGFHSLVLLLLRSGARLESNGNVLGFTLQCGEHEITQLLIQFGADVRSTCFEDVGYTWNPEAMRLFLEHGSDPLEDDGFGKVLHGKVRTAIGIFKEYKTRIPGLQKQADMALRKFCQEGNLKWVSLLLWAGADPRVRVPDLYENEGPDDYRSGLEDAVRYGKHDVVKRIGINPDKDNPSELAILAAMADNSTELLRELLRLGAKVNSQPNGGSDVLERLLWRLGWCSEARPIWGHRKISRIEEVICRIRLVAEHGARWIPAEAYEFGYLRRTLYRLEPRHVLDLIRTLRTHAVCTDEDLKRLLDQPKMKTHLNGYDELGKILPAFCKTKRRPAARRRQRP